MANQRTSNSGNGIGAPPPRSSERLRGSAAGREAATARASGDGSAAVPPRRAERRPEMIRERREQRRREYARKERHWLWTRLGLIAFAVLAVAAIAWFGYNLLRDRQLNQVPEGTNTAFNYDVAEHVGSGEVVEYAERPPVGGPHDAAWQNCGYYSDPVRNENAVHSLEHGAVWVTYRPDLAQDQIDRLRDLARQDYLLVSPYPDLPSPVVASAWNNQLALDAATDDRLDQFIRYFKEGPQTPEPGARCTGAIGQPEDL